MCGRFVMTADPDIIAAEMNSLGYDTMVSPPQSEWAGVGYHSSNYNVAPTSQILVVRSSDPHTVTVMPMRWGLVPIWAKSTSAGPLLINARSETAAEKPAFRTSVARWRCLIPMNGWYEWVSQTQPSGRVSKQPFYIHSGSESIVFAAGLWSPSKLRAEVPHSRNSSPDEDHPLYSCTILTANSEYAPPITNNVHDRMPRLLSHEECKVWLAEDADEARTLLSSLPDKELMSSLEVRPVSKAVNNVRNRGEELLAPLALP